MSRGEMHLSAFIQASPNHQIKGMWKHSADETSWGYRTLRWWQHLVRTLERGCFDGIFFADVLGTYDVYGASREAALRGAVQIPGIDPTLLIPALAACTENLGFAVTVSTSHHASSTVVTAGTSTKACFPLSMASAAMIACHRQGVAITTISTSSRSRSLR